MIYRLTDSIKKEVDFMRSTPVILSIDDDANNQELLKKTFEDKALHVALSGEEGLAMAAELKPDVILLDIAMPGMNGIEVCRRLKADADTSQIPVLFVSAMNTLEDRLTGYKAGAEDYICKPINLHELKCKIEILLAYQGSLQQLDSRLRSASEVAYTAMSTSGELGVIVSFVENALNCPDFSTLADHVLDALSQYQVNGCLVVRGDELQPLYFSNTVLTPLETQLLDMAKDGKRIVSVGRRCIFNADTISILIKDMPADEDRGGRLRDHVARLVVIADARVRSLVNEQTATQYRTSEVCRALNNAGDSLRKVDERMRHFQHVIDETITVMMANMERQFMTMMLSDEQEDALIEPLRAGRARLDEIFDESSAIDSHMEELRHHILTVLQQ